MYLCPGGGAADCEIFSAAIRGSFVVCFAEDGIENCAGKIPSVVSMLLLYSSQHFFPSRNTSGKPKKNDLDNFPLADRHKVCTQC